jgi:hypothetical protein
MTEIENFLRRFPDYKTTPSQLAFAKYLEQQGLRFLVDFGFENAERITWELIEIEGVVQ